MPCPARPGLAQVAIAPLRSICRVDRCGPRSSAICPSRPVVPEPCGKVATSCATIRWSPVTDRRLNMELTISVPMPLDRSSERAHRDPSGKPACRARFETSLMHLLEPMPSVAAGPQYIHHEAQCLGLGDVIVRPGSARSSSRQEARDAWPRTARCVWRPSSREGLVAI